MFIKVYQVSEEEARMAQVELETSASFLDNFY